MSTVVPYNHDVFNPSFVGEALIRHVTARANAEIRGGLKASIRQRFRAAKAGVKRGFPVELVYITDNGHTAAPYQPVADLAEAEVRGRLSTIRRAYQVLTGRSNIDIQYENVASQDTLGGAAQLYQRVVGEVPVFGRFVFLNVAPRKEQRAKKNGNGGESIYIAVHKNGTVFGGVGKHSFSFFKPEVEKGELVIFKARVETGVSQFRSRDFFPWFGVVGAHQLQKARTFAGKVLGIKEQKELLRGWNFVDQTQVLSAEAIPDLPNNGAVATSIDVHGNLKTALRGHQVDEHFPEGGKVYVLARGQLVEAHIKNASFDGGEGKVAVSRGSTFRDPLNLEDCTPAAVELFKVGQRIADDLRVTAADLRDGLTFHVFDAAAFDHAHNMEQLVHGSETRSREELAAAFVEQGMVKGLDNTRLRQSPDTLPARRLNGRTFALTGLEAR